MQAGGHFRIGCYCIAVRTGTTRRFELGVCRRGPAVMQGEIAGDLFDVIDDAAETFQNVIEVFSIVLGRRFRKWSRLGFFG